MQRKNANYYLAAGLASGLLCLGALILVLPDIVRSSIPETHQLLEIDPPVVNLGKVTEGVLPVEAKLVNRSSDVLIFTQVRPTCNCTVVSWDGKELKPGETIPLKLEWDIRYRSGVVRDEVVIEYTRKSAPDTLHVTTFSLEAEVLPEFMITPEELLFEEGKAATVAIRLTPLAAKTLAIRKAVVMHPAFTTEMDNSTRIVRVTFDPVRWIRERGRLEVTISTDNKNRPLVRLPIRVRRYSRQSAEASSFAN